MTDPWQIQNTKSTEGNQLTGICGNLLIGVTESEKAATSDTTFGFEDNFTTTHQKPSTAAEESILETLPDSENYLKGLETKLENLKKGVSLVEALSEKRQSCIRIFLNDTDERQTSDDIIELNSTIESGTTVQREIYRHLQPVQPLTLGETVNIVEFDQLERQPDEELSQK